GSVRRRQREGGQPLGLYRRQRHTALADPDAPGVEVLGQLRDEIEDPDVEGILWTALEQGQPAVRQREDDAGVVWRAAMRELVADPGEGPGFGRQVNVARLGDVGANRAA